MRATLQSAENRRYLQRSGGHYILGEKLRDNDTEAQAALGRQGRSHTIAGNLRIKEVIIDQGTMRDRFVICHNPEEAKRDKEIREQLLAQITEQIADTDRLPIAERHKRYGQLSTKRGYKQLLEIERGWRDMKTTLDLRPVHHRKEDRIRAQVIPCWLALLPMSSIELRD